MVLSIETDNDGFPFIRLGKHLMILDKEELTGEYKDRALRELKETSENVEDGLQKLRKLIENEKDLYVPLDDESFLIKFLRPFKFNADQAFKVLRRFYKFKIKHPKYGKNITPDSIRHVFDNEVFVFLPTRTNVGARIMIINCGTKWNPKVVSLEDMFRAVTVGIEIAMLEPKTQVGGVHVILNMEGLSLTHVYQFSPSLAKLIVDWVQECSPTRLKGIHVVNQPYLFNMLYALFKPFLGEFLKKRLSFHGTNQNKITEKINAEALPEKFGGCAGIPQYPFSMFSDMLHYYEKDFKLYNTYGYVTDKEKSSED